jgi:hypothetical protein
MFGSQAFQTKLTDTPMKNLIQVGAHLREWSANTEEFAFHLGAKPFEANKIMLTANCTCTI